uniref:Uncharacterized protein n=1 Tax=Arundo donax TaxID=35708 RepID=A0A0A8XNV9_ARUDO
MDLDGGLLLVDGLKKISGVHTARVKMYEKEHQPPAKAEKGKIKRCISARFSACMALDFCFDGNESQL